MVERVAGAGSTVASRTAARRRGPIWALLAANAVSNSGNQLTALAVPWFVLETTGSAARAGVVGFFTLAPTVIASLAGGTVVDRLGPKRTSVASDLLSGATVALIPLLHALDALTFPLLLALVFLGALLDVPGFTARGALHPDLIALGGFVPERANAHYEAVNRAAGLVGPLVAGVLIAAAGAAGALWVDAASFFVSALLIGAAVPGRGRRPPASGSEPARESRRSFASEFRAGIGFLWRDRLLRTLALAIALTNALDAPLAIALAVYARQELGGVRALALIVGTFGGAALVGALLYGAVGHRLPRRATFVAAFVAVALPFSILATTPSLPIALAVAVLSGLAAGPINPLIRTVKQERVPPELRGRVFGALDAVAWSAMPLGVLAGGVLIEAAGVGATFAAIAAGYLAATVALAFTPALRAMNRPTPTPRA